MSERLVMIVGSGGLSRGEILETGGGEEGAVGCDSVDLGELTRRVKRLAANRPRVFVAIDGPGAAGKSMLAARLAMEMEGAHLIHVDDFYLPSIDRQRADRRGEDPHGGHRDAGAAFDLVRLARQVVVPGAAGEALRYQRYDWAEDELAEWIDVPEGAPVVLEGVFCLSAALRSAYTFTIWCTADPAIRLGRGVLRDGEEARSMWVDVWMAAEAEYAVSQQPERIANLVVDSSAGAEGAPVFRVVAER